MNPLRFQNVAMALGELIETEGFKALWDSPDAKSQEFRQGVEWVQMRCLALKPDAPTDREIEDRLLTLEGLCVAGLARFRRFILMAREALHAA